MLARLLDVVREQFADQVLGLLVGQVALIVEAFRRIDHHFRLVHRVHVQKHESLAQMVLRAGSADDTNRRPP